MTHNVERHLFLKRYRLPIPGESNPEPDHRGLSALPAEQHPVSDRQQDLLDPIIGLSVAVERDDGSVCLGLGV